MHRYAAATPHPQRCVTYVPIARGVEIRDLNGQRPPATKKIRDQLLAGFGGTFGASIARLRRASARCQLQLRRVYRPPLIPATRCYRYYTLTP